MLLLNSHCSVGCQCDNIRRIDNTYQHILQAFHTADRYHNPATTGTFFKSYWDEKMAELKRQSIDTHQQRVAVLAPVLYTL